MNKGQLLTSFVEVLVERGNWEEIRRELSAETMRIVESQPLPSAWISGASLSEIQCVFFDLYGGPELRDCAYLATKRSAIKFLQPFIEATLRLFGVSPASLLNRIDQFSQQSTKGMASSYTATGPTGGTMRFSYPGSRGLSLATLESGAGSLRSVFDLTKTMGSVGKTQWIDDARSIGQFDISWQPS